MIKQPLMVPTGESEYTLVEDYSYTWVAMGNDGKIKEQVMVVPKYHKSDGASVPRFLWSITGIRPDGLNRAAALIHDFIYENKGVMPKQSHFVIKKDRWVEADHKWTRKEADRIFCRLLRQAGVGKVKRRMAFIAVRVGGYFSWKE